MLTRPGPAPSLIALAAAGLLAGCSPKIGDKCGTSLDCSQTEERLCDTTQPGGYCTKFNCEPDNCPDGACVAFGYALDTTSCGILDAGRYPRFQRTFCMATCDDDSDCRSGYQCVSPDDRRARIVDTKDRNGKICVARVAASECKDIDQPCTMDDQCCSHACVGMKCQIAPVCGPGSNGIPWTPYNPTSSGGAGGGGAGGHVIGLAFTIMPPKGTPQVSFAVTTPGHGGDPGAGGAAMVGKGNDGVWGPLVQIGP